MWLDPLQRALSTAQGPVAFFFRDDDAGWGDAALHRLVDAYTAWALPIDLAVIPRALSPALAGALRAQRQAMPYRLGLHQHGYAHVNHEAQGRKCEFGPRRSAAAQMEDIAAGHALLTDALGEIDPFFTPPWNRCTQATVDALGALGFAVLSRDAGAAALELGPLCELPVTVDWCKGSALATQRWSILGERIAKATERNAPIGILLHHAVMEDADFVHLQMLLAMLSASPNARCVLMRDLLASQRERVGEQQRSRSSAGAAAAPSSEWRTAH